MSNTSVQPGPNEAEPAARKRERHAPTERGVRVRMYPNAEQVQVPQG